MIDEITLLPSDNTPRSAQPRAYTPWTALPTKFSPFTAAILDLVHAARTDAPMPVMLQLAAKVDLELSRKTSGVFL